MSYVDALQAGTQVDQYVIETVLGQGGFGIVYRARHPVHGVVALKEFFPKSQASRVSDGSIVPSTPRSEEAFTKGVEKLIAEGDKLKGLKHENIVKVIEVFEHNHTAYLVMEDVDGPTLQAVIDERKLVANKPMVETFATQMIDALALIHSAGLIHRDIAPDNILVDLKRGAPRFVLIDFGGAKRVVTDVSESSSRSLTKTGFSSPEQYGSESAGGIKATAASDVYGLAATLYWLISGRKPIDAPNRHVQDTLVRLAGDDALEAVYGYSFLSGVDHGLSMRPDARPQNVEAFRRALKEGIKQKTGDHGGGSKWLATATSLLVIGAIGLGGFGYAQGWFSSAGAVAEAVVTQAASPAPATSAAVNEHDPTIVQPVAVRTEVVKEVVTAPSEAPSPPKPRCRFETQMRNVTQTVAATEYRDEPVQRTDSRDLSASGTWNIPSSMIVALNSGRLHVVDAEERCDSAVKSRASSRFRSQCYGGVVTDEEEPPLCTCNPDYSGTCSWESSAKCEKTVSGGTRRVPYQTQRQVVEQVPERVEICD
jgi:serine/threonine protein kinase